jgi:hypothetical protein
VAQVTPEAARSDRAAVIFDVDGVLRVFSDLKPDNYTVHDEYPYFAYNPAIGNPVRKLLEKADGYYISLWRENCHQHIGKTLLLPELDWINDDPFRPRAGEFSERSLAINGLFGDRPVAWIDDEIDERDHRWAEQRSAPTLLMPTDEDIGLTVRQAGLIESWLTLL